MANIYRGDFPVLGELSHGKPLVYLDNAATTQKPFSVISAVEDYYKKYNANPHRGAYDLSVKATQLYEDSREVVRDFVGAKHSEEIIFTRGTTEAINLIAYSFAMDKINKGDEIVISIAEHHSNLVPWQQVAKARGAKLVYLYTDDEGEITSEEIRSKITPKTKLVSVAHISNVLGNINPIQEIIAHSHEMGAVVMLDLAQSIPHVEINVVELDVDFAAFSGHKIFAPMGIGVLYGKKSLLDEMPPFIFGGDMIEYVSEQESTFAQLPQKFEGGTQNVGGAIGLAKAIEYINNIGFDKIQQIESNLTKTALELLQENPYVKILGSKDYTKRTGVISFTVEGVHPHDVSSILDASGVAIRSGHHCAHPLMSYYNLVATCRMSLCFYNTEEEIRLFADKLKTVRRWLGHES